MIARQHVNTTTQQHNNTTTQQHDNQTQQHNNTITQQPSERQNRDLAKLILTADQINLHQL